ncbi:hypothetical protein VA7868_01092 [Vibrio aerogenes CECT 7868]|uniref:Uncharacterized protein n=1 Tax=Vibrio aerogenes CECT 7868 TaxID=1216006 RepID=A0A1M5XCH8_9VIBR|nr:hypothetical protein VA7868_01092 [Vibrio aerogenes CECT 7868]
MAGGVAVLNRDLFYLFYGVFVGTGTQSKTKLRGQAKGCGEDKVLRTDTKNAAYGDRRHK